MVSDLATDAAITASSCARSKPEKQENNEDKLRLHTNVPALCEERFLEYRSCLIAEQGTWEHLLCISINPNAVLQIHASISTLLLPFGLWP